MTEEVTVSASVTIRTVFPSSFYRRVQDLFWDGKTVFLWEENGKLIVAPTNDPFRDVPINASKRTLTLSKNSMHFTILANKFPTVFREIKPVGRFRVTWDSERGVAIYEYEPGKHSEEV